MPTKSETSPHMQDAQGPIEDHMEEDITSSAHPSKLHATEFQHQVKSDLRDNKGRGDVESGDDEWDISTPNIKTPHTEWPINSKELELLMPKKPQGWLFAKQVFADPTMWNTKSWQQEKFTISRTTHPEIKQHWQQRHMRFAPGKHDKGEKISSVYWTFLRLLIAEFLLKWKVDYSWENNDGTKKSLRIHPTVTAISRNMKESMGRDSQPSTVNRGKRKVDEMEIVDVDKKEGMGAISEFFGKKANISGPSKIEVGKFAIKSVSSVETTTAKHNKEIGMDSKKEKMSMADVCKNLGLELGQIIEKDLCPKYGVMLCSSSIIDEYKSKLQAVELKGKEPEKMDVASTTSHDVMRLKSQIFDQNEKIAMLTTSTANLQRQLQQKEKAIERLENIRLSNEAIIKELVDGDQSNNILETRVKNDKSTTKKAGNFVTMQIVDPTQENNLYPDVEDDSAAIDQFFDQWKNDKDMATFVRETGDICMWCRNPWGPESVSILGTCGHLWHHACLSTWLQKSRKCWCRKPFYEREYAQRGLLHKMPPMETQADMSEYDTQLTQADSMNIDQFTINESNFSDGDFDRLLLSGQLMNGRHMRKPTSQV